MEWYEIFALVRASAISARIALLKGRTPGDDPTLHAARAKIANWF
jgi:hypothetical protein